MKLIATYEAEGVQGSIEYDGTSPYNADIDVPRELRRKWHRRGLPDDYRLLSVYDVEADDLINFD